MKKCVQEHYVFDWLYHIPLTDVLQNFIYNLLWLQKVFQNHNFLWYLHLCLQWKTSTYLELLVFPSNGRQFGFYVGCTNNITTTFFFLSLFQWKELQLLVALYSEYCKILSSLINTSKPLPNWFLSSLTGSEYPCNKTCPLGKDLSNFVSVIRSMSILPLT